MKVSPFFFIFWLVFALFGDVSNILYVLVCAVIHEAAHICAFIALGAEIKDIELMSFGISASLKNTMELSCKKEMICAAAGPTANIVFAAAAALLTYCPYVEGAEFLVYCNAALAGINLIPIIPLDGGRIIYFILLDILEVQKADKISKILSLIFLVPLTVFGVWLALYRKNVSVIMICAYLIAYNIFV